MGMASAVISVCLFILSPVILILRLIIAAISIILAPLFYLGKYTILAGWYPIHIISRFEALYIFLGVAIIIGALTGTSIHLVSSFIFSLFRIEDSPNIMPFKMRGSLRAEEGESVRLRLQEAEDRGRLGADSLRDGKGSSLLDWDRFRHEQIAGKKGKIPNTILEEEDSSEVDF